MLLPKSILLASVALATTIVHANPYAEPSIGNYESLYTRDASFHYHAALARRDAFAEAYAEAFAELYDDWKFSERSLPDPSSPISVMRRYALAKGGSGGKPPKSGKPGGGGGPGGSKPPPSGGRRQEYDGITPDNYRWDVRIVGHDHSAHWHACPKMCAGSPKEKECTDSCKQCAANLESQGDCSAMGKSGRGDMGMASMFCSLVTDSMNKGSCGNAAYKAAEKIA